MKKLLLAATLMFAASANAATYQLSNMGFESGLTDWVGVGDYGVLSTYTDAASNVHNPYEGSSMGFIRGQSNLLQSAFFASGDTIEFMYKFIANDYLPFNDFAFYVGGTYVQLGDVAAVGDYGNTGWKKFSYTFSSTYSGNVIFGIANIGDSVLDSVLLLDSTVPVPAAAWLFGSALMGLAGFSRRKTVA